MTGKSKWHWRMLVSATNFAEMIPRTVGKDDVLVFSAMLNVAELLGLRPDLTLCGRKILYVHENQLEYPKANEASSKSVGQADFNLCWNQIVSCMCVDQVYFNSDYNMGSFFNKVGPFLNRIPTASRATVDIPSLKAKSSVLYVPIDIPLHTSERLDLGTPLHIVWAHRWEHDKGPEAFITVLELFQNVEIESRDKVISLSVLGDVSPSARPAFESALEKVRQIGTINIVNWGRVESRDDYISILRKCDVAVSTSLHEFFGVSMVEAATCGAYPICPNRLSYPELFPKECLYNTTKQLFKKLKEFARRPQLPRQKLSNPDWRTRLEKFQWGENNDGPCAKEWKLAMTVAS
eukprot:CAMPEP_0203747974 /NCGR_PEP_ID=MMETSP0098-20131031/2972_1 /ASSEMBLY_ACC=CAM_ASM_000208 /TAXON_ID=96639 /ORGANISM=" , Strain NY0313808BC1" /LENGTH=349 /DNA_ID=CAMNT_0050636575 /DNA_START=358 /DNA_END=1407 /DNA_ORIENTATION=+